MSCHRPAPVPLYRGRTARLNSSTARGPVPAHILGQSSRRGGNQDLHGRTQRERYVLKEFKEFINKGNIFEAAVGLIMALAFVPVVQSMVDDMIMPVVARIFSQPDFSQLQIGLGGSEEVTLDDGTVVMQEAAIRYGAFINEVIAFMIIGFVIFFLVKAYSRAMKAHEEESGPSEIDLLTEIRDGMKG